MMVPIRAKQAANAMTGARSWIASEVQAYIRAKTAWNANAPVGITKNLGLATCLTYSCRFRNTKMGRVACEDIGSYSQLTCSTVYSPVSFR